MTEQRKPYLITPPEVQDLSKLVLNILQHHRGAQNAITGRRIARLLNHRNDRQVRLVIQSLIAEGFAIAANVAEPLGYYLIETPEEARAYAAVLRSRAIHTFRRMRDFEYAAQRVFAIPPEPFQPSLFEIQEVSKP